VSDIVAALTRYVPQQLPLFIERLKETGFFRSNWIKPRSKKASRIAIQYNSLGVGGVQNVIFQHMKLLIKAGYEVFLILDSYEITWDIPSEVELIILDSASLHSQLVSFEDAIKRHRIQIVVNHDMYSRNYVHYHTVAKTCGCDFVFWLHSFCLRFFYDFSDLLFFHEKNLALMDAVVVLSQTDVAFWRWLGHENVHYLPNPISQYLIRSGKALSRTLPAQQAPKLLWVGRLHQSVKKVLDLIMIVDRIRQHAPGVHLKIVGAEGPGLSKEQLLSAVTDAGLTKNIEIVGEVAEGIDEYYREADFLLYTSVIEGFPMTLIEASSFGLPIVMYELPWLEITKDNKGIRSVPQGDFSALASEVLALCNDPSKYEEMSKAGSRAIQRIVKSNVGDLLDKLLQGELIQSRDSTSDGKDAAIFAKFFMLYYEHVYRQAKGIK
jgi:glycosyltransferase involved in cell wall biosynthesis